MSSGPGGYVLIVDDDTEILEVLRTLLELEGYRVRTVTNGPSGLDLVRADVPDLILLDMRMPTMDGWEFYRLLREMPGARHVPVVVMTADHQSGQRAREVTGFGHLQKPFDMMELYDVVGRVAPGARM
jgi:two-component system sensor histidine kinase ChiS